MPEQTRAAQRSVFFWRLAVAIIQAAVVYWLVQAGGTPLTWPATQPAVFLPLFLLAWLVPLVLLFGLGQVRLRALLLWAAAAGLVLVVLGFYATQRGGFLNTAPQDVDYPSGPFSLAVLAALFVAQVLAMDAARTGRLRAPYPMQFDSAWKLTVQAGFLLVFTGVFWLVLQLGAGLFGLIGLRFFGHVIHQRWFALPATTLAAAASIHITDVQPALIRGIRSLALVLFSWLLPLLTLIAWGFLLSLPFTTLAPLWQIHFAGALLLSAAFALIFLINCTYQNGDPALEIAWVKQLAVVAAALALIPLTGLAAVALGLRVAEYGWSVQRIYAAAVALLAAVYALGYAGAIFRTKIWMQRLEVTNFFAALVFIGLVLALFSPAADPSRLMVASQMERLTSGATLPASFDFLALKRDGAGWGLRALKKLSTAKNLPNAPAINTAALTALQTPNDQPFAVPPGVVPANWAQRFTVYPTGRHMPAQFITAFDKDWQGDAIAACFQSGSAGCIARFLVLNPGGPEALLVLGPSHIMLFEQDKAANWHQTGIIYRFNPCGKLEAAFTGGQITPVPPVWPDLMIAGHRYVLQPYIAPGACGP